MHIHSSFCMPVSVVHLYIHPFAPISITYVSPCIHLSESEEVLPVGAFLLNYHTSQNFRVRKISRIAAIRVGRNTCDKNIHEGGSDTLHNTITWLLCSSVRLVGSLTVDESFSVRCRVSLADSWQYSFSKRPTGAARFFQEDTGPASFNSHRLDILPGYVRARDCYFCMLPHSLLAHFSWGKAITTANDRCSVHLQMCR